jgi:eukaryotic-like serine/threonine-protein kinase
MRNPVTDSPTPSPSMLPPDWRELAPLVDAILDAPHEKRAAMLAELGGTEPGRRSALELLVAECEREAPLLEKPAFERFDELLDDPEFRLPDILSDRYRIGRELGRGGMARVYLAHDLKHQRDVALKVIRPDLAASLGREQFLREIAIAAHLRHPNIVPLYDSGDDAGALYFVMPFEAGPSLRDKLQRGPLTTPDAVSVLRDVARALAYAHEQGIVHRDVKPDNVMLSSGAAVVADFGIARAFHVAQAQAPATSIAHTGVFGTPAYMAPEQAAGDSGSDHRADIYSFGCMAYELFVGRPPFGGDSAEKIITAHFVGVPRPVSELRPDIPPTVAELISRCLEKHPDARPQSATELVAALDTVPVPAGTPAPLSRRLRRLVATSIILIASLALAGYVVASRRASSGATGPATIAVLPFVSAGGDSTHALFAEGLGDEIASALVKVPWVRIMSRRGVTNYRGQRDIDYRQAGRDLGARYLLTGSAREAKGHEIVMLRLISAKDGSALWAERFDRPSTELEAQRNEMVRSIAQAARPLAGRALSARSAEVPPERPTSGEAYFYQVQAQQWLDRRGLSVKSSAEYFRRAIAVDPAYARAYSGLSLALALYPYFQYTPTADVQSELTRAARRALQLDSTLAQPHIALGLAHEHNFQWDSAGAEFTTAIHLDNHDVEARVQYGRYLLFRGRTQEGLAQFQAAREADPASAVVLGWVAYAYYLERRLDSARVISERAMKSNALNFTAVFFRSLILLADGHPDEARQLVAGMPPNVNGVIYVMAVTEKPEFARLRVQASLERRTTLWMLHTARAYGMMGLGDTAQALDALESATKQREIWPSLQPPTDRIFDGIRESPRFKKLLEQVGLADTSKASVPSTGAR